MSISRGIVYIATGEDHRREAEHSAERLENINAPYDILLVTDERPKKAELFDRVSILDDPNYGFADKPSGLRSVPYDRTIYLDSDTYVVNLKGLEDLFKTLEHFDVCGTLDSARTLKTQVGSYDLPTEVEEIPDTFTWINTGVLAFNREATIELRENWRVYQRKLEKRNVLDEAFDRGLNDQAAFRWALFESSVTFQTVPPEYNFRLPYPASIHDTVHIIHGNSSNMAGMADVVNRKQDQFRQFLPRMWTSEDAVFPVDSYNLLKYFGSRVWSLVVNRFVK